MGALGPYLFSALASLALLGVLAVLALKIRARMRLHLGALERRLDSLERRLARGDDGAPPPGDSEASEPDHGTGELAQLVRAGLRAGQLTEPAAARLIDYLSELEGELRQA